MDETRTTPELEAQLEAERLERELLFGAQSRLYAAVSTGAAVAERPADDSFLCEGCQLELLPGDALTALWVERQARDADGVWWPAGVDLLLTACPDDRATLLDVITSRAADLAVAAAGGALAQEPLITYVPSFVDWPADLPPEPEPTPEPEPEP
jgi:hypothetical protein